MSKPSKAPTLPPKTIARRDATGHLSPQYENDLRQLAEESHGSGVGASAFINRPKSADELAEQLGESFVKTATSGEQTEED
jgi:hypothetical protein